MSIAVSIYGNGYIVMASDSRVTNWSINSDGDMQYMGIKSDNVNKLFKLCKKYGLSWTGTALIDGEDINEYLKKISIKCRGLSVSQIANLIQKNIFEHNRNQEVHFQLCGYENDLPIIYEIDNRGINECKYKIGNGVTGGEYQVFDELQRRNEVPKCDNEIELAKFIVEYTIDRSEKCGGFVDILLVTSSKAYWNQCKNYNIAKLA